MKIYPIAKQHLTVLVFLLSFLPYLHLQAQQAEIASVSDVWVGTVLHEENLYSKEWNIILNLRQTDTVITGTSKIEARNRYAIFNVRGEMDGRVLITQERELLEEESPKKGWGWCLGKKMTMNMVNANTLEGTWSSPTKDCSPGKVILKRVQPIPEVYFQDQYASTGINGVKREISVTESFNTKSDSIVIKIWDNNQEDGDIVTLKFNGESILDNHKLTKSARVVKLPVHNKSNILELYAEDLGRIHPNTAAIYIVDEQGSKQIILNSDFVKSEAIRIDRK